MHTYILTYSDFPDPNPTDKLSTYPQTLLLKVDTLYLSWDMLLAVGTQLIAATSRAVGAQRWNFRDPKST